MLIALVLALVLWRRGDRANRTSSTATGEPSARPAASSTPGSFGAGNSPRLELPRKPPPNERAGPPLAPIITKIDVEKAEVCEGEENLIKLHAHTPGNKEDAHLKYLVATEEGIAVPYRVHAMDLQSKNDPPPTVTVFGRNNVATRVPICIEQPLGWNTCDSVKLPPAAIAARFKLKPCRAPYRGLIRYRILPNEPDRYEFYATITPVTARRPFDPVSFEWSFGDGSEVVTTSVPVHYHDYGHRDEEKTRVSNYLVKVRITGKRGDVLEVRKAVQLRNDAFENLNHKGVVVLKTRKTPTFPVADDEGVVKHEVHIWHHHDKAVVLSGVIRQRHPRGNAKPEPAEHLEPQVVLGTTIIPPGKTVTVELDFDTAKHKDTYSVLYQMSGTSEDGWRAGGRFSLMRPPALPTRDKNIPVRDPLQAAKILAAMKLLNKKYVTDEELWRLEKEGALKNVTPIKNLDYQRGYQPELPKGAASPDHDTLPPATAPLESRSESSSPGR